MPKILLTKHQEKQYEVKKIQMQLRNQIKELGKSQRLCAQQLNISQPSFSYKLNNMSFDLVELLIIADYLDVPLQLNTKG